MRKRGRYFVLWGVVLCTCLVYFGVKFYNSDDKKFDRYLDKISSIERKDVKAIDVTLSKDDIILRSYSDNEKAYLMLDLLHEIKHLNQESSSKDDMDYSYSIWNAIETTESMYAIQLEVNEANYNLKITEINIDRNENKKITITRYFKADDKSTALTKQLMDVSK